MNALVSYDSSDDGDEVATASVKSKSDTRSQDVPDITQETTTEGQDGKEQLPILGPSIPSATAHDYEQYDDDEAELNSQMTDRDMIRHLTQASHPMTEMPPSPPGSPDVSAGLKFRQFIVLKTKGIHFNEDLAGKNVFKNPSLLQNLMERAGFDEQSQHCTSLPTDVFDVAMFPPRAFKEQLLQSQQKFRSDEEANKKVLSAAGKRSIEFASAGTVEPSSRSPAPAGTQKRQKPQT